MAKFIFKMESILSVKTKLEDQAKAEYGIETMRLREEEHKLMLLENRKSGFEQQLFEAVSDRLVILSIKRLEDSVENLKYNIKLQIIVIRKQEERVAQARAKLDNAMKERKIYEKLKEKAFEEFKAEVNAQEQKEIDQLVSFRFRSAGESED
ncbi:MAG: flagellar export protein FliJ [Lachnospiraceae bacterium]|nr:flagellar export protein FliJ [Lachnospiraceae bacterium]MCI9078679.1 flagellar export protein FliJ [Lachnospiraceae bacterium]MDE7051756.1 flagellar export protein FliJ [Lachnospiraceae bacterium]